MVQGGTDLAEVAAHLTHHLRPLASQRYLLAAVLAAQHVRHLVVRHLAPPLRTERPLAHLLPLTLHRRDQTPIARMQHLLAALLLRRPALAVDGGAVAHGESVLRSFV